MSAVPENRAELGRYVPAAFEFIPLRGKRPVLRNWRTRPPMTPAEAFEHMESGGNIGIRLNSNDLVLDVDPRNGGDASFGALCDAIGSELWDFPRVITGGNGSHVYMRKAPHVPVAGKLPQFPGVEFKTIGTQVVAAGSSHPDTGVMYTWDVLSASFDRIKDAPANLIALIARRSTDPTSFSGRRSPEDLVRLLEPLDPCDFRNHDDWFKLLGAAHHATGGAGRAEFIEWSTGDPEFLGAADEIAKRWDSLNSAAKDAVTERTLFGILYERGHGDVVRAVTKSDDFEDVEEEALGSCADARVPGLVNEFVYIVEAECFVRRSDAKRFSEKQFKALNAHRYREGDILTAVWKGNLGIPKIESMVYLPGSPEIVEGVGLKTAYNIWRDTSVAAKPGDVSIFTKHMAYLFPNEQERSYVLDFLALLIKHPAEKIHFALLLQGGQGTGKSWLGALIRKMIGDANVARPNNDLLKEKFNQWQEGAQVGILEEIMASGSREVVDRLKPVITEDNLCIRPMGRSSYNLPNRLNLVGFTNHRDALHMDPSDRRWLVVFSPAIRKDDDYYARIWQFLEGDGPSFVAHWLKQRDVQLNPKSVPPMTEGKAQMHSLSLTEAERHLVEMFEDRSAPFDFDLVRVDDIIEAIPAEYQQRGMRNQVGRWLSDHVRAQKLGRFTKTSSRRSFQLWAVRNQEQWIQSGAAACIDAYLDRHPQHSIQ